MLLHWYTGAVGIATISPEGVKRTRRVPVSPDVPLLEVVLQVAPLFGVHAAVLVEPHVDWGSVDVLCFSVLSFDLSVLGGADDVEATFESLFAVLVEGLSAKESR